MPLQQAKVTKFLLFYLSEGENFIKGLLAPIEQPKQAIEFFF